MATRDEIRAKLLAPRKKKSEIIDLFGADVELRQPTIGMVMAAREEEDSAKALANLMITYCYVPGSNEKVFEAGDVSMILDWPVDKWLTDFNNAVERLSGINVEAAEGN